MAWWDVVGLVDTGSVEMPHPVVLRVRVAADDFHEAVMHGRERLRERGNGEAPELLSVRRISPPLSI